MKRSSMLFRGSAGIEGTGPRAGRPRAVVDGGHGREFTIHLSKRARGIVAGSAFVLPGKLE
jgi:hypothetical protein